MTKFRNFFEEDCYNSIGDVLKKFPNSAVSIEHNRRLEIDDFDSFSGKISQEIDIIIASMKFDEKELTLLIDCKYHEKEDTKTGVKDIRNWGAVLNIVNKEEGNQKRHYLGLVISSTGFTTDCETIAKSFNLGLIPSYKGRHIFYPINMIYSMVRRVVYSTIRVCERRTRNLFEHNNFYAHVYKIINDYEHRMSYLIDYSGIDFSKNLEFEEYSFSELWNLIEGKIVKSAADWGGWFEIGLSDDYMLRIHTDHVNIVRTKNPLEKNRI